MYKIIYDTQKSVKIIKFLPDCVKNCSKQQINLKKLLKKYKKQQQDLIFDFAAILFRRTLFDN